MATLRLRDRDAIVTKENLVFRVLGYWHPSDAYFCDVEYAPERIFVSDNPKAFRKGEPGVFYKFYEDEGWRFLHNRFPRYLILHEMLQKKVVGVDHLNISEVRKPGTVLEKLVRCEPKNELLTAVQDVVEKTTQHSGLSIADFGVFGSLLHGFYNPEFSDIDLVVYGKKKVEAICETLEELYRSNSSSFRNEFEMMKSVAQKKWRFRNFTPKEYVRHQQRKQIYALFDSRDGKRIKTEFEPVKDWKEVKNEYSRGSRISQKGWTRMLARLTEDNDALFIPSVYGIAPMQILDGEREALEATRIISYVEEFRGQARRDETVVVEGNLEKVTTPEKSFYQITLTYCPRYYEQVLKVPDLLS